MAFMDIVKSVGNTAKNIASTAVDSARDAMNGTEVQAITDGINSWLSSVVSNPASHWGAILASAQLQGGKKLGRGLFPVGKWRSTSDAVIAAINSPSMLALIPGAMIAIDIINKEAQILQDPNIEGIVIQTESLKCTRQVNLSDSQVILQQAGTSDIVADNAVPRPREWSISGYISSVNEVDYFYVVKPSLITQTTLLDAYAKSRKPVWFKDDHNLFHKVQILDFTYDHDPKVTTAVHVTLSLREFAPLMLGKTIGDIIQMIEVAQ